MTATQEQLDQYCACVLQPLAESLMLHSKELGASPSAFYQAGIHHVIYALNKIAKVEKHKDLYKDLSDAVMVLEFVAKHMAAAELEGK